LKPEQWGSPLVQEKYQEEKACDKRHPYRIIIIIIDNKLYNSGKRTLHKKDMIGCVHNYTSTMNGNRGRVGQKNSGMNTCQDQ